MGARNGMSKTYEETQDPSIPRGFVQCCECRTYVREGNAVREPYDLATPSVFVFRCVNKDYCAHAKRSGAV